MAGKDKIQQKMEILEWDDLSLLTVKLQQVKALKAIGTDRACTGLYMCRQ